MTELFRRMVEEDSAALLRWAYAKTGHVHRAEELTQEVWLQFFSAANREAKLGRAITQPEHLLWRVARYVWLKSLRQMTSHQAVPLEESHPDPADFAADLAEQEEQARLRSWVHQRVVSLSRVQREVFIRYYVEQHPQREIVRRLGISEATVRWHLFDGRRKIREGASNMEHTEFVYRPRTLEMGINGQDTPNCAVNVLRQNLLMQNICCACYAQGRTVTELAGMLGVASPYIEHDLEWLTEQELITESHGRYFTSFMISTTAHEAAIFGVFKRRKPTLCDAITSHLRNNEGVLREIGFIGSDRPMDKLLWLLIYLFTRRLPMPAETPEPPIRPDGGKYWPLGFDRTQDNFPERNGFAYNGSMTNEGFFWFGLHDFGHSEIEPTMDGWTPEYKALRTTLEKLIFADFDPACITGAEQFLLAQLIEKGFVIKEGECLRPNFVIMTKAQYDRLYREVFAPLAEVLQPELLRLAEDLHTLALADLPPHLQHLAPLAEAMAQHDVGWSTEFLSFQDGTLYHPTDKRDGEFLTLAYIFR